MGYFVRLSADAGAIVAKAKATLSVLLSSFEAELDSASSAVKAICRLINILIEFGIIPAQPARLECDNQAMLAFATDQAVAKGARHMELRQWFIKEKIKKAEIELGYKLGTKLYSDKLTKPTDHAGQRYFAYGVLGQALLTTTTSATITEATTTEDEPIAS